MRFSIALLILAALSGCGESRQPASKVSQEQRAKVEVLRLHEAPEMVIHQTDENGDMVVMKVVTGGTAKSREYQRCFIWRDYQLKTATMSCPNDQVGFDNLPVPDISDFDQGGSRNKLGADAATKFVPYAGPIIPLKSTTADDGQNQRP